MDQSYPSSVPGGQSSYPGQYSYHVDMVLCIDVSRSMAPYLRRVREQAEMLPNLIYHRMQELNKSIYGFRVKLLFFNSDTARKVHTALMTDFLCLPWQQEEFNRIVNGLRADGTMEAGGGLEALAYAVTSQWIRPPRLVKSRQVIALWTDAAPGRCFSWGMPAHSAPWLPGSFEELSAWWGNDLEEAQAKMNQWAKRLLLFAPNAGVWRSIAESWDNVIPVFGAAGTELGRKDFRNIATILLEL